MPNEKPLSLRERKKRRTRQRLIETSNRLFAKQGYDKTTLDQIADEVEISVRTLLAYFPSKDRLATVHEWDAVERLQARLDDPERSSDTMTIWREFVEDGARGAAQVADEYRKRFLTWMASPTLRAARLEIPQAFEDVLARGLAGDFGLDPEEDLAPRLIAAMLSFGNQRVVMQWVEGGGKTDLVERTLQVIDFAREQFLMFRDANSR